MKLVVGLGNPGLKYAQTRHNFGFMVIEELVRRHGVTLTAGSFSALSGSVRINGEKVILLMPQTFMNNSGRAVGPAANYYRIAPEDILVIYDDLDLALGEVRLRAKGSAGGHNGMKSIIAALGTQEFARLRLGIDRPTHSEEVINYVLSNFPKADQPLVEEVITTAADAAELWITDGVTVAMSKFNGIVGKP
ncbi:MAG: aminoacyl-tRNA hydrolase [Firmicutes bacterium]|nr:aminoacyl-tRNA hydrolase [Bacillota bacterium]